MLISLWLKIFSLNSLSLTPLAGWWTESGALKHERLFASLSLAVIKLQRQRRKMQQQRTHTHSCYSLLLTCERTYVHQPAVLSRSCKSIRRRQNPLAHGGSRPPFWPQKALIPPTTLSFAAGECGPLFSERQQFCLCLPKNSQLSEH